MKEISAEVNELLQVSFTSDSMHSYASRVEDVQETSLQISWPTENGVRLSVRTGEEVFISFTRQDAVYGFRGRVENTIAVPVPIVVVTQIAPTVRTQRREYVRVPASIPMELVGVLPVDESSDLKEPVVLLIKGNTLDLSGGGFSICHKEAVPQGTILKAKFQLPGQADPFTVSVRVMRCTSPTGIQQNKVYRLGLMFFNMPESIRSRIVRHVFSLQNSSVRS